MRKIPILLFFLFIVSTLAQAQKPTGNIKGILMDTAARQPLAGATVSLVFTKDSSMVTYAINKKQQQCIYKYQL